MKNLRSLVGALHIGYGLLSLVPLAVVTVVFGGVWSLVAVASARHPDGALASTVLGVGLGAVLLVIVFASALLGLASIIGGVGVVRGERWGDWVTAAASAVHLVNPPLGSLLALATVYVLFIKEPAVEAGPFPVREATAATPG
jgi:hypothetical protein